MFFFSSGRKIKNKKNNFFHVIFAGYIITSFLSFRRVFVFFFFEFFFIPGGLPNMPLSRFEQELWNSSLHISFSGYIFEFYFSLKLHGPN